MTGNAAPRLRLPRSQRLQESFEFKRIREQGRRLVKGCLIVNWMPLPSSELVPRLGVVTSRKLGNAVARSRARRLLREVFRLHQHDLAEPVAMVLIARPSITQKKLAEVELDFIAAMRQAKLIGQKG